MYKVIDLGFEVPETGEPQVQLIQDSLIKTASSEIQTFWDSLKRNDNLAYLWVIGVSAHEYYGCNNNGDGFTEEDLKKTHQDFVQNANVFLQHVNKDPAKGIGKPVFSWYNDAMHRVELILGIEKGRMNAAETVRKISAGEPIYVSMGCTVKYDVCSICGNHAPTRKQYCEHLRYNMKKILPDGRQVYAMNPDPKFFDISIVAKPADPTAHTLDKMASNRLASESPAHTVHTKTSADLGEEVLDLQRKQAALKKLSDIVKQVEGRVVDAKEPEDSEADPAVSAAVSIGKDGFKDFPYPEMPYESLSAMGVSPAGFMSSMRSLGAPLTLGDAAWMAGSQVFGRCPSRSEFSDMFSMLPGILSRLMDRPELMGGMVNNICSQYAGECDAPVHRTLIIRVLRPVAQARITMISSMAPEGTLSKFAEALGAPPEPTEFHYGRNFPERLHSRFSPRTENFAQITLRDKEGREAITTPYHLRQADGAFNPTRYLRPTVAAALAMGAISAAMSEPTLLGKILAASALGIPAAALLSMRSSEEMPGGTTSEGVEIPMSTMIGAWKHKKTASSTPRVGTVAGMALPGALALDYMYNRWKYGLYAEQQAGMGETGKALNRAGYFVTDHPMATTFAGGLLGSQAGRAARGLKNLVLRTR